MALRRFVVLAILFSTHVGAASENGAHVPFVGCPGDGQLGSVAPPSGKPVPAAIAPNVAAQLAFYKGTYSPGVFAPAGWHCREWYGSNGSFVVVTPVAPPDRLTAQPVPGPGVELVSQNGGTSGRFSVAEIAARFFPDLMRDFIQQVRDEKLLPESKFSPTPYSKDTAKRIGDRMVEFSTPARSAGFGTEGLLTQSGLPIRGIVALNPATEETGISVLRVRLPPGQETLSAAILGIETRCLQKLQGCDPPR